MLTAPDILLPFRDNHFGCLGLTALICAPALCRVLQIVSVNVPVETLLTRVWATTVVALPFGALVLSLFDLRFDHSLPLSLIVLLFSFTGLYLHGGYMVDCFAVLNVDRSREQSPTRRRCSRSSAWTSGYHSRKGQSGDLSE